MRSSLTKCIGCSSQHKKARGPSGRQLQKGKRWYAFQIWPPLMIAIFFFLLDLPLAKGEALLFADGAGQTLEANTNNHLVQQLLCT
mmetsp:Transcript_49190/g.71842  ORF Transcript_49190/g.71842 Transcript_49190/m.71842 type:complete len:86 (+) Transcript_49190:140-397(+)